MRSEWRVRLWAYAPVFLWIGIIFLLSSPEGSFNQTSRIIGPLLQFFFPDMAEETRQIIHGYVRKAAHFTEYAALAFLAVRACTLSAPVLLQKWRYVLPLVLLAVVASLDELNQSFETSRTSSIWDVLLDISGGAAMLIFLWLMRRPRPSQSPPVGT
jgi:VanZ family protein